MVLITLKSQKSTFVAMNSQRSDGTLCDVKLVIEDGQVFAHKAVLAACSPYFNTMFTGGFREGDLLMTEVNMSEVFPDLGTAERIIESMYTDQLDITLDNVCTLYSVCTFLLFNEPIQVCEDFMTQHLCLETCLEYWQATYYHNTSGELHSSATNLLKNRFHDRIIYQDCLLDVPTSTVSSLLKAEITKFCSLRQILDFLVNWFLKSRETESTILKHLVMEANLPAIYTAQQILKVVHEAFTKKGTDSQTIQDICEDLGSDVRVLTSEKRTGGQTVVDTEEKQFKDDLAADNARNSRKRIKKTKDERVGSDIETDESSVLNMGLEKEEMVNNIMKKKERAESKPMDKAEETQEVSLTRTHPGGDSNLPSTQTGGVSKANSTGDCKTDRLSNHVFSDLLEKAGSIDVILAIAPSFTGAVGNINEYQQLRLFAYLPQPQLWVELGTAAYPRHESGEAISVSKSRLYTAGGNVYLLSGADIFYLRFPSNEWKKLVLPIKEYRDRQIFPLLLKNSIFLLIIDYGGYAPSSEERNKLMLCKVMDDGAHIEILQLEETFEVRETSPVYGPCWVSDSCFLVHRTPRDEYGLSLKGNVLHLDPESKDITFASYEADYDQSVRYNLGESPVLLEFDDWFYFWKGPTEYPSSSGEILQGFRMTDNKSRVLFERKVVKFSENMCRKRIGAYIGSLPRESPSDQMITTSGSRLWCLGGSSTSKPETSLHEFGIQNPDVLTVHTPPPCNVILAVTTASLDSGFLSTKPLARYHHIHDPIPDPSPFESDIYEDYDDYDLDYDDYDVDYDDVYDPQEDYYDDYDEVNDPQEDYYDEYDDVYDPQEEYYVDDVWDPLDGGNGDRGEGQPEGDNMQ